MGGETLEEWKMCKPEGNSGLNCATWKEILRYFYLLNTFWLQNVQTEKKISLEWRC